MHDAPLSAAALIDLLDLRPLPGEGGYFRQTYVLEGSERAGEAPPLATAILYLVTPDSPSALHRLRYDEIFHFHLGDPCEMVLCDVSGELRQVILGHDLRSGEVVQQVVPALTWQGLKLRRGGSFALLGTTMAPGFHPDAFALADRGDIAGFAPRVRGALLPYLADQGSSEPG